MIVAISGKMGSGKDTVANMLQYHLSQNPGNEGTYKQYNYLYNERSTGVHQPEWEIKKFADKIKDTICLWLGCTREELEDRDFKEEPLGEEWRRWFVMVGDQTFAMKSTQSEAVQVANKQNTFHEGKHFTVRPDVLTPRKLMQLLGTECGREIIHPNLWVSALFAEYTHHMETIPGYSANAGEADLVEDYWIISDMRFPNELHGVRKRFGTTIRVERPTELRFPDLYDQFQQNSVAQQWESWLKENWREDYDKIYHPSETSLDHVMDWNYIIQNTESLQHLFTETKLIAEDL